MKVIIDGGAVRLGRLHSSYVFKMQLFNSVMKDRINEFFVKGSLKIYTSTPTITNFKINVSFDYQ